MTTCTEIVLFFPNICCCCFKKNDGRTAPNQSPIGRQSPSELVVDQSPISHRLVADLTLTDCRLIAKQSPNVWQLIGDSSATGQRPYQLWKNSCNGRAWAPSPPSNFRDPHMQKTLYTTLNTVMSLPSFILGTAILRLPPFNSTTFCIFVYFSCCHKS